MPFVPQQLDWPGDSALLLVHGVGNAMAGDYDALLAQTRQIVDPAGSRFAIYQLYYDEYNDWLVEKTRATTLIAAAKARIGGIAGDADIAPAVAETVGDVIWPVLSRDARMMIKEVYLAQLHQILRDGERAGHAPQFQRLHIICHSLGCFHTYEALHTAARIPGRMLGPASMGVRFGSVIFMASPVQLIRTVGRAMGAAVPRPTELATLDPAGLSTPSETTQWGDVVQSADRVVSITGALDPVGGYFFRRRAGDAYMALPGQESLIDPQDALNINTKAEWLAAIQSVIDGRGIPKVAVNNPHSWEGYVARHAQDLRQWLA
jgi:hypothetical protein